MKTNKQYYLFFQFTLIFFCYGVLFLTSHPSLSDWGSKKAVATKALKTTGKPILQKTIIAPNLKYNKTHVPSITFLDPKKLMCAWYAGSKEGASDVSIYTATYENQNWNDPKKVMDVHKCSQQTKRYIRKIGNAVVFKDNNNISWMLYCSIAAGGWAMTNLNYMYSKDDGVTWSQSKRLILGPLVNLSHNVKNDPIFFEDGSFLLPIYQEFAKKYGLVLWGKFENGRLHYKVRRMSFSKRCLQPSIVYLGKKKIQAYYRNRNKGKILTNHSSDLGLTWSTITETELPNPNSGFDMTNIDQKKHLGVINYSSKERDNLYIVTTENHSSTWEKTYFLEKPIPLKDDPRYQSTRKKSHYYHYSSAISNGSDFHVVYTAFNQIKHVHFNTQWLKNAHITQDIKREKTDD